MEEHKRAIQELKKKKKMKASTLRLLNEVKYIKHVANI